MIVLDASAAVAMVRRTPEGSGFFQLMLNGEEVVSHGLFPLEVSNAFLKCKQAGGLSGDEVLSCVEKAASLVDEYCDVNELLREALSESVRLDHSVDGMLYFVLARRNAATLFTLDQKLAVLCAQEGVNCIELAQLGE